MRLDEVIDKLIVARRRKRWTCRDVVAASEGRMSISSVSRYERGLCPELSAANLVIWAESLGYDLRFELVGRVDA